MNKRRILSGTGLILAAILAVGVIILANTTLTSERLDLTQNKLFTLSQGTVNIIKSLKEPISLDFYFSRKSLVDYPQLMTYASRVRDLLGEYAALSNGKIKLTVIEPEPFSEAEDDAVANGLRGIAVNTAGDRAYLGLVGTNSTDDKETIPFFQVSRESSLEYDITKLVYNLAHPDKRVVGVISSLPLFGAKTAEGESKPWAIIDAMKEFFEVKNLGTNVKKISGVKVLMVVHPKQLSDQTLYAIDQYVLGGGKAMIFVDPLAEHDRTKPDPDHPYTLPKMDSYMKKLFDAWGIEMLQQKIAGDANAAMRVQARGPRGPQTTTYLPWLKLDKSNLNRKDFATSELQTINMATAGILEKKKDATVTFTPLIETSKDSMEVERDLILFQRDPNIIMNNFKAGGKKLVLAARLSGKVKTAFPDGPPPSGKDDKGEKDTTPEIKEGDINAIVVADTDILADMFWTRKQSFFGVNIPQTIADNGKFVVNSLENLSGNTDLISLRSRGEYERPFVVVEKIRRKAEDQFREREQQLQNKLKETEKKIAELQKQATGGENVILSPEQKSEIERFRQDQITTRKELRAVQHNLQKDIEHLGSVLKFINIGLAPLLIALLAVGAGLYRHRKRV
jgi:ABC-type uncharacterized transport system involved in gliding motility auxiliary subunit